ncbi:MAG: nitroreductase [Ignavibacteriales bacterium]
MNVADALVSRYSVRAFRPDPIERGLLLEIMDSAIHAPSWANTQPWEVFIAGGESLDRLRRAYTSRFDEGAPPDPELPVPKEWPPSLKQRIGELVATRFAAMGIERDNAAAVRASQRLNFEFFGAPAVAFPCLDRSLTPWSIFDMGSLSQSIMLSAREHGVGSVPAVILAAYPDLIRAELEIPKNLLILIGIALGYEDTAHPANKARSTRRPVQDVVRLKGL